VSEFTPPSPPPAPPSGGPSGPRASFGARFGAYLIDVILIGIVQGIIWALTNQNVASAIGFVIGLAYFVYFEGGPTGQTLGKRALGIRVYDFTQGGPIGYGRAVIRYLARILSAIACLLGYLWMLWDGEKQTWHDKLATTVVVPVSVYPVQQ
jgi:uncharacterized RDD family membrane protein YckC